MKVLVSFLVIALCSVVRAAAQSETTTQGFLMTRVTTADRNDINKFPATTAKGTQVYDLDTKSFWYWDGVKWVEKLSADKADPTTDGWIDDSANSQIKLRTQSNGLPRFEATEFTIKDDGRVGIGVDNPDTRAILDLVSGDKGLLLPRLSLADVLQLASDFSSDPAPPNGLLIYNTTFGCIQRYHKNDGFQCLTTDNSTDRTQDAWVDNSADTRVELGSKSVGGSRDAGTEVVIKDDGKVGVGTVAPSSKLHIYNGDFLMENDNNWNTYTGRTYADDKYPQLFLERARGSKSNPTYPEVVPFYPNRSTLGVFKGVNAIDRLGGAGFRVIATETQNATSHGSGLIVFTTPNNTSNNKDCFIVNDKGNVGIGTSGNSVITPLSKLDVNGYVKLRTTDGTADALTNAADRAGMIRYNNATGVKALQYHDDTGWRTLAGAATSADLTNDAWVNDNTNTQIKLGTLSDGTTARSDAANVVIKDDGKVGIGLTDPPSLLSIRQPAMSGSSTGVGPIKAENLSTGSYVRLGEYYAPNNTTDGNGSQFIFGTSGSKGNASEWRFRYYGNDNDRNRGELAFYGYVDPVITYLKNGNVGIGTTTPQKKLHVNGSTQLSGELSVGGTASTEGNAGASGQVLASNGSGTPPSWVNLGSQKGTLFTTAYRQGTSGVVVNQGETKEVPGVNYTITIPAGESKILNFTVVGYALRSTSADGQAAQGVFSLHQDGVKISSAYTFSADGGDLSNVPNTCVILKSIPLSGGTSGTTYVFTVHYAAWHDSQKVNHVPSDFGGYDGDAESMLTKMMVTVFNN